MRLWPFPKKSDSDFDNPGMDLPEGVMLASPDEEPQSSATMPTYVKRGDAREVVDPAAALAVTQETPPFSPMVASSDNPALDEAFNKLFMDGAPSLALPETDPQVQPFLESVAPEVKLSLPESQPVSAILPAVETLPMTPMTTASFASEPVVEEIPGDSLDQLLAKLTKTTPATPPQSPKFIESLGLLDDALAPPTTPKPETATQPQESTDTWGLAPMEAPPLSPDWSIIQADPSPKGLTEPAANPSLSRIEAPMLASDDQMPASATSAIAPASQAPAYQGDSSSSLTDILGATMAATAGNGANIAEGSPSYNIPAPTWAEQSQPASPVSKGSILDTLIPPPSLEAPSARLANSSAPEAVSGISHTQPETLPDWGFEDASNLSAPALDHLKDDFSLIPPATDNWGEDNWGISIQTDSLPEIGNTGDDWAAPRTTATEYENLDALAPPALDALAIDESEEGWNEDVLLPESAQLNSSSNAYDLNHYDDPDEPSEVFELEAIEPQSEPEKGWTDKTATADLDNLLSQLKKPQCDDHQPASTEAQPPAYAEGAHKLEPAPQGLDISSLFAGEFEAESEQERSILQPQSEAQHQLMAQTEAMDLPPAAESPEKSSSRNHDEHPSNNGQEKSGTEPPKKNSQMEAQPYCPRATEAGEEQMLRLKGNKSAPEQSLLEALSAKFIAYPKDDSPNTKAIEDAPNLKAAESPAMSNTAKTSRNPAGPEQSLATNIQPPSLSQALSNFEEETLLKETRFIRQSINNLVDRYFAQQEQDNSY